MCGFTVPNLLGIFLLCKRNTKVMGFSIYFSETVQKESQTPHCPIGSAVVPATELCGKVDFTVINGVDLLQVFNFPDLSNFIKLQ